MGRRRKRSGRSRKRSRVPGWYRRKAVRAQAARLTVLSLLAMLFLVVIVPAIFAVAGGYNALVADTRVWEPLTSGDYQKSGYDVWGVDSDFGWYCLNSGGTGHNAYNADGWITFPDEQEKNWSSMLVDLGSADCSTDDDASVGFWVNLVVDPADLLVADADQIKMRFRSSLGAGEVQVQSDGIIEPPVDGGYWATVSGGGISPNFLQDDQYKHNYSGNVWVEITYYWTRVALLQVDQEIQSVASGRFTFVVNITDDSYSPMDWDGEVIDVHFRIYSEGGGYSLWGDVFGWSLGMVMVVMAAAATPYWNPLKDNKRQRHWRKKRRWSR